MMPMAHSKALPGKAEADAEGQPAHQPPGGAAPPARTRLPRRREQRPGQHPVHQVHRLVIGVGAVEPARPLARAAHQRGEHGDAAEAAGQAAQRRGEETHALARQQDQRQAARCAAGIPVTAPWRSIHQNTAATPASAAKLSQAKGDWRRTSSRKGSATPNLRLRQPSCPDRPPPNARAVAWCRGAAQTATRSSRAAQYLNPGMRPKGSRVGSVSKFAAASR